MKKNLLVIVLSISTLFALGQCGPFAITSSPNNLCNSSLHLSGASGAQQIIWQKNGVSFDTTERGAIGITVGGSNGVGSSANQIVPDGIYGDTAGNIYVVDAINNRVQKFPAGSTSATNATTVAGGNGSGNAANQLRYPAGIFVDAIGNIFIADAGNNRIQKFPAGSTSTTNGITVAGGNGQGSGASQFYYPTGVFVDAQGNIYVADQYNQRIQKFAAGNTSGITIAGGNGYGTAPNQFQYPNSIYVDLLGSLYVSDAGSSNRIQKFPAGSTSATNGTTVAGGNGYGTAANQLSGPTGISVDASGNVYVADPSAHRIQKFPAGSSSATNGVTVAGGYGEGSTDNQLALPQSVYVDAAGSIYVSDYRNKRIQKWLQPSLIGINSSIDLTSTGSFSAVVTDASGCVTSSGSITIYPLVTAYFTVQPSTTPHLWYLNNQCTGTDLSYRWIWSQFDTIGSFGPTPSHTYDSAGYYNICVYVSDTSGCSVSYCDSNVYLYKDHAGQMVYVEVTQSPAGILPIGQTGLTIGYSTDMLHFSEPILTPAHINLYDLSGRKVMEQNNFKGDKLPIDTNLAHGIYILHLQNDRYQLSKKVLITQ